MAAKGSVVRAVNRAATAVGFRARPSTASDASIFHTDEVTIDGMTALAERVKLVFGDPGSGTDASARNPLPVSFSGNAQDVADALTDGRRTVTVPGTAVRLLTASTPCKWVTAQALLSNTAVVAIGGSGVLATIGAEAGSQLQPGDSVSIPVSDVNKVFVDALVGGEGVTFTAGA